MLNNISRLFLTTALAAATVLAQSNNPLGQRIAGSWLVSITLDGAATPFAVDMATFHDDGSMTVIASDRGESNAVGSYRRAGNREFNSTHTHVLYNPDGTFAGIAKVIGLFRLSDTADTFAGRYRVEVSTAAGIVVAKVTGVITGKLVAPETL